MNRQELKDGVLGAVVELLAQEVAPAGALVPIRGTWPQQYVAIGDLESIKDLIKSLESGNWTLYTGND